MKRSTPQLEEMVGRRLVGKTAGRRDPENLGLERAPVEFVKVEKNLASLGYFTPSNKRIKDVKAKEITFTRVIDGIKVEASATIVPAAIFGLPTTADQDKYLALQKLIADIRQRDGKVSNPIKFTSAEILSLLRHRKSGRSYKDIEEWLNVMYSTTIISKGVVYLAGRKVWATDRFRVFDRAVSMGKEMEGGRLADKNYVWLSEWQLENINNNHVLPVDLETYRKLKNHVAKALVPLLQIWLYASRQDGAFEKRYDELCEILSIHRYEHLSRAKEQLGPSLDELQAHGYLASWAIERTADGQAYKVVLHHGEKFHRDRRLRLGEREAVPQPAEGNAEPSALGAGALLGELKRRGIAERVARRLLRSLAPGQDVLRQIEYVDQLVGKEPWKYASPTGFLVRFIENNDPVAPSFLTRGQCSAVEERQGRRDEQLAARRRAYEESVRRGVERYIETHPERWEQVRTALRNELFATYPKAVGWEESEVDKWLRTNALRAIAAEVPDLVPFERFTELA
jgi:plasmid replication initiation protein